MRLGGCYPRWNGSIDVTPSLQPARQLVIPFQGEACDSGRPPINRRRHERHHRRPRGGKRDSNAGLPLDHRQRAPERHSRGDSRVRHHRRDDLLEMAAEAVRIGWDFQIGEKLQGSEFFQKFSKTYGGVYAPTTTP